MSEALHLFDLPPASNLRPRQQVALDAITEAGWDGLHTDEVGAAVHAWQDKHSADERCDFCGSVGRELGVRLREMKLVKQTRRPVHGRDSVLVWTVPGRLVAPRVVNDQWPKGF